MIIAEGERVKKISDDKVYQVNVIQDEWVVLIAEDGSSKVLAGRKGFPLAFAKEKFDC